MSVAKNRELLKQANPSKQWADQVDKMPAAQVVIALAALKSQKKIEENK